MTTCAECCGTIQHNAVTTDGRTYHSSCVPIPPTFTDHYATPGVEIPTLTKLEIFTMHAMQGLCANPAYVVPHLPLDLGRFSDSIDIAKATLAALDRPQPAPPARDPKELVEALKTIADKCASPVSVARAALAKWEGAK